MKVKLKTGAVIYVIADKARFVETGKVGCEIYDAIDPGAPTVGRQMADYAALVAAETRRRARS